MRYFKYSGATPDFENTKISLKNLAANDQKRHRRAIWLHRLGTVVFWTIFLSVSALLIGVWNFLKPTDGFLLSEVLFWIGGLLWAFISVCIGGLLGAVSAAPLWAKREKSKKQFRQQILQDSCAHLREFYDFQEPFAVTKCYESTDRKFSRHDVCLFVVDGELRITANLHYGFFHPEKDLGCYAVQKQEITLQDTLHKDRPAVELSAGDVTFCLSRKAKPFVEQFLNG